MTWAEPVPDTGSRLNQEGTAPEEKTRTDQTWDGAEVVTPNRMVADEVSFTLAGEMERVLGAAGVFR